MTQFAARFDTGPGQTYLDNRYGGRAFPLTRTANKTSAYTAALWNLVPCDTTSAGFTVTLPAASGGKGRIVVKLIASNSPVNPVSFALTGTDKLNNTATTVPTLSLLNQGITFESDGASIWTITSDDLPLTALDSRYTSSLGNTVTVQKDPVTGFWPVSYDPTTGAPSYSGGSASSGVRPTSSSLITVFWKGPDPAPAIVSSGTGGMLNNVDVRIVTP